MQHRLHGFPNLPTDMRGWTAIIEPAKDAYWLARRNGKSETDALLAALDVAVARVESTHQ